MNGQLTNLDLLDPILTNNIKAKVSILAPAHNESAILQQSVEKIYEYMSDLEDRYDWEMVIVNDGSKDNTGKIADAVADSKENMRVYHHKINKNLGGALRTGFSLCKGDYVVVLDLDLSYAPEHIGELLDTMQETEADVVVASPYMPGGRTTGVPLIRKILSKAHNRLTKITSGMPIHTFTSMVRAYRKSFLDVVNLKSSTYAINPEILQKAFILRARVVEIPAHLDWSFQNSFGPSRISSMKILKGILGGLMTSFIFRPYMLFMTLGTILMVLATYIIVWIGINTALAYTLFVGANEGFDPTFSKAIGQVFHDHPHSFIVGSTMLILSVLFLSLGFLSLQNKRYFDELFHLGTAILRQTKLNNQ